jgi:hypothetical protein
MYCSQNRLSLPMDISPFWPHNKFDKRKILFLRRGATQSVPDNNGPQDNLLVRSIIYLQCRFFFLPSIGTYKNIGAFQDWVCTHKKTKERKVAAFNSLVLAEIQTLDLREAVVCFVSPRFSTVALSRKFSADRNSCCMILTTCRLYVWVKSSEIVNQQYHTTARSPGGGEWGYICVEAADNTFRNRNINVTQLGKKARNLLNVFLEFRFVRV